MTASVWQMHISMIYARQLGLAPGASRARTNHPSAGGPEGMLTTACAGLCALNMICACQWSLMLGASCADISQLIAREPGSMLIANGVCSRVYRQLAVSACSRAMLHFCT